MAQQDPSGIREVNFKFLLTGLLLLMLGGPVLHVLDLWHLPKLLEIVFGVSFLVFVASLAGHGRDYYLAMVPAFMALICAALAFFFESRVFLFLMLLASLLFFIAAIRYAALEVFMASAVNLNKIFGSVCIYLLLVLCWAIVFQFLELITPGSFNGLDVTDNSSRFDEFVYFSLVTITTLGYGDTTPANLVSGILAGLEALAGVFYIAILVASLVGDFLSQKHPDD